MAYNYIHSLITFTIILNALLFSLPITGRKIPENIDKKQPEFLHHDGTFLIPGFGRYMHPKKYLHCENPFKYNVVTGTCGGNNLPIPGRGGSTGSNGGAPPRGFIPGGDDTNIPNPGVEVPIPNIPGPSHP